MLSRLRLVFTNLRFARLPLGRVQSCHTQGNQEMLIKIVSENGSPLHKTDLAYLDEKVEELKTTVSQGSPTINILKTYMSGGQINILCGDVDSLNWVKKSLVRISKPKENHPGYKVFSDEDHLPKVKFASRVPESKEPVRILSAMEGKNQSIRPSKMNINICKQNGPWKFLILIVKEKEDMIPHLERVDNKPTCGLGPLSLRKLDPDRIVKECGSEAVAKVDGCKPTTETEHSEGIEIYFERFKCEEKER